MPLERRSSRGGRDQKKEKGKVRQQGEWGRKEGRVQRAGSLPLNLEPR